MYFSMVFDTACSGNLVSPDVSILPCKRPYCSGKKCSVLQDCAYIIPFCADGCLGERGGIRLPRFCRNRKKNNSRNTQSIFIPPTSAPSKSLDLPPVLPSWVVVNENCRITVIVSRGTKGYKVSSLAQLKIHIFTSLLWPSQSSM